MRAEHAPGLPLRAVDGGLVTPGAYGARPGEITWLHAGATRTGELNRLPVLRPAEWLDPTGLTITELKPVQAPEPQVSPIERFEEMKAPDLRVAARIGRPSGRTARVAAELREGAPTTSSHGGLAGCLTVLVVLIPAAMVAVGTVLLFGALFHDTGLHLSPIGVGAIAVILYRLGRRRGHPMPGRTGTTAGRPGPHRAGGRRPHLLQRALTWLTVRTPAMPVVRRRHERYLRQLTRAFQQSRWDDALRQAIALNGTGHQGLMTLRLPSRRTSLRPTPIPGSGSASVPYGETVYQHLHDLYRSAARSLEEAGRVEEAAFTLADLLNAPGEAVDLLERHKKWRMAAELAEGRALSPDLTVRLWWRAGDRERASDIARSRGAFASGITLLERVDAAAAQDLRRAWVLDRQAAGDHVGAVEAAWPDESLRSSVLTDIQAGLALGGPDAAHLFAHLVAQWPGDAARGTAQALLDGDDADGMAARSRFGQAFASLRCADAAADRDLATTTLRALVRDEGWSLDGRTLDRLTQSLSDRADPLAAADLPRPRRRRPSRGGPPVVAAASPGTVTVFDAVVLAGGAVLVACGDVGTRLLTVDGRVRARWDTPAHQLVVADHGGAALLVTHRETVSDVHRLDLVTRRVRHWTTLSGLRLVLPSYDGGLLTAVQEDGIVVLDTLSERPRVVWREMKEADAILSVSRTPSALTALGLIPVTAPGADRLVQAWTWDLPTWTLRGRPTVESGMAQGTRVLASGRVLSPDRHDDPVISADGDLYVTTSGGTAGVRGPSGEVKFQVAFPDSDGQVVGLRSHAGIATVFDHRGRVVGLDARGAVQANLRVVVGVGSRVSVG
ncbi:hypothetical protein GCM10023194_70070 [Planotetraspora phitsanulokensis]|uniref:Uncharacterized protein n=1 Tax=Planotetraspora phitsanulokensis TaxID=575192 RepID=A0A8J3U217_9ACTN|nr:hypothetical protein Pph01_17940 [Planotetraspora phitsanulokensis]